MVMSLEELRAKVAAQKTLIPSLYGDVDFSITPERFTDDLADECALPGRFARKYRPKLLADRDRIERARAYTMLGDTVADAYAALIPQFGFRRLIGMLTEACDKGVDKVEGAPQELIDFIQSMERIPEWLDMDLVNQGARVSRIAMANLAPFAIRGAFVATFMNKYSGLPMALTGTLSDESSVQRVKETASFFTTATLPGALQRFGTGFKAAAMVRLMHSMVRFNILKRSKVWDVSVYGIPIPQVDQMPAGTMPAFITAFKVIRKGRKEFTRDERAIVELCRYQSYLLGLPEDLLPDSPREIFNAMMTYGSTLRDGYDDETCGALVRSTMSAYLPADQSLRNRIYNSFEKSFSKVFFSRVFLIGDEKQKARQMGVQPSIKDYLFFAASNLYILPQMTAFSLIERVPVAGWVADQLLIRRLNQLLVNYGHAEYTTDPAKYKDVKAS
ncbi:MAG: oxygenase MpaB family protein [Alcanivoracaceae bacterium]|nr:oxygenase MpaB family protein [Alcanivoracaceae bacterium]